MDGDIMMRMVIPAVRVNDCKRGTYMKKIISFSIIVASLLASRVAKGQGTVYLSNLGDPSTGSATVGSDSWLAASIVTGFNSSGYELNSIQLAMTDATGNPSDFRVMLYTAAIGASVLPGSNLGNLEGSANPSTAGTYTYAPTADIFLSPNSIYFIMLTADTIVANGAYGWTESTSYPNSNDGWFGGGAILHSNDGLDNWHPLGTYCQYALAATAIPEPTSAFLLLLGSGVLFYVRRAFQRES